MAESAAQRNEGKEVGKTAERLLLCVALAGDDTFQIYATSSCDDRVFETVHLRTGLV